MEFYTLSRLAPPDGDCCLGAARALRRGATARLQTHRQRKGATKRGRVLVHGTWPLLFFNSILQNLPLLSSPPFAMKG
jgi:hypothetical protein